MGGTPLRYLVILALACFAAAAQAEGPRRVDELMRKSGLWTQLGQAQDQVRTGALEQRAKEEAEGRDPLTEDEFKRLTSAIDHAFAADRLRENVGRALAEAISPADEAEVLRWLGTDLGTRFTRLEEEMGEPGRMEAMQRDANAALAGASKARVELIARFADAVKAGEVDATLVINLVTAVAYGAALSTPTPQALDVNKFKARMQAERPKMVVAFRRRAMAMYAYAYRDVTDDDFARYIAFAESAAGRNYHSATVKALDAGLMRAALDLGLHMGVFGRQEPKVKS